MKEARELENAEEILEIPVSYEERGKEIGKEIGREEVLREGTKKIALNMLRTGIDVETIIKLTEMKQEEIEQLKNQL